MEQFTHDTQAGFQPLQKTLSIHELGASPMMMQETWNALMQRGEPITLSEFPHVDVHQVIDERTGQTLMDFTLECLALIQEQRRQAIRKKQAQGIQKARDKGIKLGRRPLVVPEPFFDFLPLIQEGNMTITAASRILAVDYKTVKKWVRMQERMGE